MGGVSYIEGEALRTSDELNRVGGRGRNRRDMKEDFALKNWMDSAVIYWDAEEWQRTLRAKGTIGDMFLHVEFEMTIDI